MINEYNIRIDNLIIEVTRKCNLHCDHCLRGEAQNIDMCLTYIDTLFEKIDSIGVLTFSGGEPSLNVPKMVSILELAKSHNIDIGNFYLATNGTNSSNEFIHFLIDMFLYCSDNEITQVQISNDCYHDIDEIEENRDRLKCLKFVSDKFKHDGYDYFERHVGNTLLKQGKNKEGEGRKLIEQEIDINVFDNDLSIEGDLYLNCLGFLIKGCDFSYEEQNNPENVFCHLYNFDFEILRKIEQN